MNNKNRLIKELVELYSEFRQDVAKDNPGYIDDDFSFSNFMYWALNKHTMSDEITGCYIDLPTGSNSIAVNGGEDTPLVTYTEGIVTPETETHYGIVEWDASVEIETVKVNDIPVEVEALIGGQHPTQRPK